VYSKTMKMHLSSRMISSSWTTFAWESSVHSAISRMADCDRPVYWIVSPSLSGLNLEDIRDEHVKDKRKLLFDRKFPFFAIFANGLVDPAISTAADETNDVISISDPDFAGIRTRFSRVNGL